jgi:hypothetical protein
MSILRSSIVVALTLASVPAFAQKATGTDDLSLLPADSELVAGLDFQQAQTSLLWKQLVAPKLGKGDAKAKLSEFQKTCGVDPMKVVTTVAIGLKGLGNEHPDGVIVAHGVPKAKLLACFDKMTKGKKAEPGVTRDGDILLVNKPGDQPVAFAFVDDTTGIIVVGTAATGDGVRGVLKGTSALKSSARFVDVYKKTNTKDTVWMIMNGNSKAFDELRKSNISPVVIFGSVKVGKELVLDGRIKFKTADEAKNVATMGQGQIKDAAKMFDKISIDAEATDVKVGVTLSDAKLKDLLKQLKL